LATAARRSDLYYRLGVFPIHLPPLRERREDLPLLVRHYLRRFSRELGRDVQEVAPEVLERLCDYSWPGNIRELQSARETLRYKLRDLRLFVTRSFDAAEDNPPRPVRLARRAAAT
jgi:DNA-binding NtrC family response regulator